MRSFMRQFHLVLGLGAGLLVLVAAVTGVLLQYPHLLGPAPVEMTAFHALSGEEGHYLRGTSLGLEASLDGGGTWREVPMLMPPGPVRRIVADRDRPEVIFVLGRDGLVMSRDGGRIWEPMDPGAPLDHSWMQLVDLTLRADGNVDLITRGGFWRTMDGGQTWRAHAVTPPSRSSGMRGLIHDLHTGYIWNRSGSWMVTAGAVALVLLVITGALLTLVSGNRRPRRG
jgi:hypothetical protein